MKFAEYIHSRKAAEALGRYLSLACGIDMEIVEVGGGRAWGQGQGAVADGGCVCRRRLTNRGLLKTPAPCSRPAASTPPYFARPLWFAWAAGWARRWRAPCQRYALPRLHLPSLSASPSLPRSPLPPFPRCWSAARCLYTFLIWWCARMAPSPRVRG